MGGYEQAAEQRAGLEHRLAEMARRSGSAPWPREHVVKSYRQIRQGRRDVTLYETLPGPQLERAQ